MKQHTHKESRECCCDFQGLEPDEQCPLHGHPWPPRCEKCGQLMKRKATLFGDVNYADETTHSR